MRNKNWLRKGVAKVLLLPMMFFGMTLPGELVHINAAENVTDDATECGVYDAERDIFTVGDFVYTFCEESGEQKARLLSYKGEETKVVLPATVSGAPLVSIQSRAFEDNEQIETVIMPDTLERIEYAAFINCVNLREADIPAKVTMLSGYAFYNCKSLEKVSIPSGVKIIETATFEGCSSLQQVELTESIQFIRDRSFYQCTNLSKLIVPSSVTKIGKEAFWGIKGSVEITSNLTEAEEDAFAGFEGKAYLPEGFGDFYKVAASGVEVIDNSGFGYRKRNDGGLEICEYLGSASTVEIPGLVKDYQVSAIGDYAFKGNQTVKKIIMPEDIYTIGIGAFEGCSNLKEIELSKYLRTIEKDAFKDCSSLESIDFPYNLKEIGQGGFAGCSALKELSFTDNLKTLGASSFAECTNLQKVSFCDSLEEIGQEAFRACETLNQISLPVSIQKIGSRAFGEDCNTVVVCQEDSDLLSVILQAECPVKISGEAIAYRMDEQGKMNVYAVDPNETDVVLRNSIDGKNIEKLDFSKVAVGVSCASITIPNSVVSIVDGVLPKDCIISCNMNSKACEYAAKNGKIFFVLNSNDLVYQSEKEEGTEEVSLKVIAYQGKSSSVTVVDRISGVEVKTLGSAAFSNNTRIKEIALPDTVMNIESGAFENCSRLQSIEIPKNVTKLKDRVFASCSSLESLYLPSTLEEISPSAFTGADQIVVRCMQDSYAYRFALDNGLNLEGEVIKDITLSEPEASLKPEYSVNEEGTGDQTQAESSVSGTQDTMGTTEQTQVLEKIPEQIQTTQVPVAMPNQTSESQQTVTTVMGPTAEELATNMQNTNSGDNVNAITQPGVQLTMTQYIKIEIFTKITKVIAGSKKFYVTWKSTDAAGYQIQYTVNKSSKNAKKITIENENISVKKIAKLTGNKRYYVRIRAFVYSTETGKRIYSDWSKARSVVTKK